MSCTRGLYMVACKGKFYVFLGMLIGLLRVTTLLPSEALATGGPAGDPVIPMADREALIEIYQTNNGAEWRFQQEWLGPVGTENRWEGVRVENGHVIELDPSGKGLTGFLSPAMGDLRQLRRIDLDFGGSGHFRGPHSMSWKVCQTR